MKRYLIIILGLLLLSLSRKVYSTGNFNPKLAKDLIRLSATFTFDNVYNSHSDILPNNYELYYESEVLGMDNMYRVFINDSIAVITLRGSTDQTISWLQNIHAAMIPAQGEIKTKNGSFRYRFAENNMAAVHGGFALGLSYISESLYPNIDELKSSGIKEFIFSGHSQGGALVKLLLSDLASKNLSDEITYFSYSFGAPMIGNKAFSSEFYDKFVKTGKCFIINNEKDIIPDLPVSFKRLPEFVNGDILKNPGNTQIIKVGGLAKNLSYFFFGEFLTYVVHQAGKSTIGKISKELGEIKMPQYLGDINYAAMDGQIHLQPVGYPIIVNEEIIIENNGYKSSYSKEDYDEKVLKKIRSSESRGYQHKTFIYYLSILMTFFPDSYIELEKKFLPEML